MNGWPDKDKPGFPVDPETDGWHWLANPKDVPWPLFWTAKNCLWSNSHDLPMSMILHAKYLGPALTPDEVAEIVQLVGEAAADAMNKILAAMQVDEKETKH